MRNLRVVVTGTALLLVGGCANERTATGPVLDGLQPSSAAQRVETSGTFAAQVDFSTLSLTPKGSNCLLVVDGQLVFSGTIEGVAKGTTSALVFATCAEVLATPPGTHPDRFKSELVFEGTVAGQPASAKGLYIGRAQPGGAIDAHLVFSNGVSGVLDVEAQVAVGGTYRGALVVH